MLLGVPLPADEAARVRAVGRVRAREVDLDAALDGLVELAARLCGTASAEINLVDADELQFRAARGVGTPGGTVARELTFCTWAVLDADRPLVVPDAATDPRFTANPFVTSGVIGGYAGVPLVVEDQPIGTMCVHDTDPFELDADQLHALGVLARAAQAHLQLREHVGLLAEEARTDTLTGLANRRALDEVLQREVARAGRSGDELAVVMMDLDRFKAYNDEHGHIAGDVLLQRAARAWRSELRSGDLVGRWGGEEFLVVLPHCSADRACDVADRLRAVVPFDQTCSAGVAGWRGSESAVELVCRADVALYAAKHRGRDRSVVAT